MNVRIPIALAIVLACAPAYAQHDHGGHEHVDAAKPFVATVSFIAASFDTMQYLGNYEGVIPSLSWGNDRFSAVASASAYRVEKNGADFYGAGDAGIHGAAKVLRHGAAATGVALAASFPTGSEQHGMGMGHLMLMPAVFGEWSTAHLHVGASLGYSRAIGGGSHEGHGAAPLVAPMWPMWPSEVSWGAALDVMVTHRVVAGARTAGGAPTGTGETRVMVAGRIAWQASRVLTALELQAGVAGDPFTMRGVVSTALSF
jgi:hypothetical protein